MWTTLNLEGRSKMKRKLAGDIWKGILDIECERDWSVGLGATLGDGYKNIYIFLFTRIFPGKADRPYSWGSNIL